MPNNPAAMHFCRLEHLAVISVTGADAAVFLQGQLTCDIRTITQQHAGLGALCTPTGRVIATVRLLRSPDGFLLLLSRDLSASVLARLNKYVLRAKVGLADAGDAWRLAGLIGTDADAVLQSFGLTLPDNGHGADCSESACVIRMPGEAVRCLLLLRATAPAVTLPMLDTASWCLADIVDGLPHIGAQLSEAFTPHMLNLDLLGAVSFQKGCYTGQEIVARTHYLGQSKRRTYRYAIAGTAQVGAALYAETQPEAVGTVVNAVEGQLLAVVQCEDHAKPLRSGDPEGPRLQGLPLPYMAGD